MGAKQSVDEAVSGIEAQGSKTAGEQRSRGFTHHSSLITHHSFWFPLTLLLAGMAAYHNGFAGVWVFDDYSYIVDNRDVRDLWTIGTGYPHPYRPVLQWTFALNYALGGLDTFGYHLFNMAVHLLAGLILFGVVRRTLAGAGLRDRYGDRAAWLAGVIALLWLVHPLQTESVIYIAQRSESLMGLLFFVCLYALLRGAAAERPARARAWYGLVMLAFTLGCGTKEVMAAAFGVLLLYDRIFLSSSWEELYERRWPVYFGCMAGLAWLFVEAVMIRVAPEEGAQTGRGVRAAAVLLGLLTLFAAGYLYRRTGRMGEKGAGRRLPPLLRAAGLCGLVGMAAAVLPPLLDRMSGYTRMTALDYAGTQAGVVLYYLRLAFWPDPLCLDHAWPAAQGTADRLLPGALILALLGGTVWALKRYPRAGFAGASFFILLAPTSGIVPLRDAAVEHRMYVPLAAVLTVAVLGVHAGLGRLWTARAWRPDARITVQAALAGVVALAFTVRTVVRNADYQSPETLWLQALALYPDNKRAHLNLAQGYTQAGRHAEAIAHYRKGYPFDWLQESLAAEFYHNFGLSLQALGQYDAAETVYRLAIRTAPRHLAAASAWNQLGLIAVERGDSTQALQHFQAAIEATPSFATAYKNLGILYARQDQWKLAQQHLQRAVRLQPDFADAHFALAEVFEAQGMYDLAAAAYGEVMRIDPDYPDIRNRMQRK